MDPAALDVFIAALVQEGDDIEAQRERVRAAWSTLPPDVRAMYDADLALDARHGAVEALQGSRQLLALALVLLEHVGRLHGRLAALEAEVAALRTMVVSTSTDAPDGG